SSFTSPPFHYGRPPKTIIEVTTKSHAPPAFQTAVPRPAPQGCPEALPSPIPRRLSRPRGAVLRLAVGHSGGHVRAMCVQTSPPWARHGPWGARLLWKGVCESISETEELCLPMGRRERRVRSRGLSSNLKMDRTWGIMRVVIRRFLVAGGAGEWPAKASSPALC